MLQIQKLNQVATNLEALSEKFSCGWSSKELFERRPPESRERVAADLIGLCHPEDKKL